MPSEEEKAAKKKATQVPGRREEKRTAQIGNKLSATEIKKGAKKRLARNEVTGERGSGTPSTR